MTQGQVDLKVVTGRLEIVATCLRELRALPANSLAEFEADRRNPAAAESFLRRALEALLDVARHLLAKAHGVGAVEYRQVAVRAAEQGLVLDRAVAEKFPKLAGYRNRLTHFYADITPQELFRIVTGELGDVEKVADELQRAAGRLAAE
ncbi:MAG TPA: DUF86 domain-containing protein [Thermoanaerobaculia bacterium]